MLALADGVGAVTDDLAGVAVVVDAQLEVVDDGVAAGGVAMRAAEGVVVLLAWVLSAAERAVAVPRPFRLRRCRRRARRRRCRPGRRCRLDLLDHGEEGGENRRLLRVAGGDLRHVALEVVEAGLGLDLESLDAVGVVLDRVRVLLLLREEGLDLVVEARDLLALGALRRRPCRRRCPAADCCRRAPAAGPSTARRAWAPSPAWWRRRVGDVDVLEVLPPPDLGLRQPVFEVGGLVDVVLGGHDAVGDLLAVPLDEAAVEEAFRELGARARDPRHSAVSVFISGDCRHVGDEVDDLVGVLLGVVLVVDVGDADDGLGDVLGAVVAQLVRGARLQVEQLGLGAAPALLDVVRGGRPVAEALLQVVHEGSRRWVLALLHLVEAHERVALRSRGGGGVHVERWFRVAQELQGLRVHVGDVLDARAAEDVVPIFSDGAPDRDAEPGVRDVVDDRLHEGGLLPAAEVPPVEARAVPLLLGLCVRVEVEGSPVDLALPSLISGGLLSRMLRGVRLRFRGAGARIELSVDVYRLELELQAAGLVHASAAWHSGLSGVCAFWLC